mmetsp:Transcript_107599/g.150051  ORF Transcript_107599/g.150051 Transcript_107599/m.150051 type:complete len:242 (-) Transcript_107599:142-867(-)
MSQPMKEQQKQATTAAAGKRRRKEVTFFPGVMVRDFTPEGNDIDIYYNNYDYSEFLSSNRNIISMMQIYGSLPESIMETTFRESTRGLERFSDGGRRSMLRRASVQAVLLRQEQETKESSTGFHQDGCETTNPSIASIYHQACMQSQKIARDYGLKDEHDVRAENGAAAAAACSNDGAIDESSAGEFDFALATPTTGGRAATAKTMIPIVCGTVAEDNSVCLRHNRHLNRHPRRNLVSAAE